MPELPGATAWNEADAHGRSLADAPGMKPEQFFEEGKQQNHHRLGCGAT